MRFKMLIIFSMIFLVIGICFAEEEISSLLSKKIGFNGQISRRDESTQCKKIFLREQKGDAMPWEPNFNKMLKEELSRLNYKFVDRESEADCEVFSVFFCDSNEKDLYVEETRAIDIYGDKNFPYLCSLSIAFSGKNGKGDGCMAFCGVKELPVEDKSKYIEQLGKIYSFLLKEIFRQ